MKRRKECLEVLAKAGFKVKIYGNGWDKADFAKNFEVYPAINFNNLLEIIVKSKIVLNIVPSFVEGSHERVFTAMLNGAVAVTDRNTYYEKEFAEDKNIVMYSWGRLNELPDKIYDLLKNEEKRERIAEAGYKEATKNHTWTVRALSIIQMVEAFKSLRAIQ
jgi:spore maturation protein CgeB